MSALTPNALAVLRHRYLRRDEQGHIVETPDEMFRRVAEVVAQPDRAYGASDSEVDAIAQRFYRRMKALEFLPNSPTLMNAGRELGQLAACFVVPVGDSTNDIFEAVRWAASIQKTGGGTGFAFSRLRPMGDYVASTAGQASGPVAFMKVFDAATEAIKQGGTRRGANMGVLRVDHPDVLDFITLKLDPTAMTNFNLSVAITDAFMNAVADNTSYELTNPRTGELSRRLDARRVFDLIANAAWATGDPGLVFLDRINASQPTPHLGAIEATNPCGEQPLLPFESCTLGSINLARFTSNGEPDWPRLREVIRDAVRFLDNVIDANLYPLPQIEQATKATRKIGLGVMGFADMLIHLGVPYDSPRAVELGAAVAQFVEDESLAMSVDLAIMRGSFPAFAESRMADDYKTLRNATTTTVAPTGTISIIAGCSSGIEPLFAVAYERRVLDGQVLRELHPEFLAIAKRDGFYSEALVSRLIERGGVHGMDEVPARVRGLFTTAHELTPDIHIRMQSAFQKHVHAAVSKTINLPHDATPADVADAYRLAYSLGCKGITVYRDRSRQSQVLAFGDAARTDTPAQKPARRHTNSRVFDACPECSSSVRNVANCTVCQHCGWSVC